VTLWAGDAEILAMMKRPQKGSNSGNSIIKIAQT